MKIRFLIIATVLMCSLMPDVSVSGLNVKEEPKTRFGDLEGPDFIQPPSHFRTLETMLAQAGTTESPTGPPPVPVSGARELLVILVEFSDVTHDEANTTARYDGRFFNTTPPSVYDYFLEVSYDAFTYVRGAVMGWYPSTHSQDYWVDVDPRPVVRDAIADVDPYFDFAAYDADDSGIVTNDELTLFIIVSGSEGGAFHWWTTSHVATGDGVWFEGEFNAANECSHIGSYCHELGHDLGLPDLYDTSDYPYDSNGIGNYGLMGGGSWTFSHPTAWSKIQLGWITPIVVETDGYYDVHDAETNAEAYVLADPAHPNEYFIIENRHPSDSYYETVGPPIAPGGTYPDEGIVIYHIDETKMQDWINYGINNVNADETHKGVDVECADSPTSHVLNADDLDAMVNRGDLDDLWDAGEYGFNDTSTPCNANWYSGAPSGIKVSEFPSATQTMRIYMSIDNTCAILIVNDDDGDWSMSGTSLPEFKSALTTAGYEYMVWSESSMGNPPLNVLTRFELVIWTCGDYCWAVEPPDAATLEYYLAQGGNLLLEGEDIAYTHGDDDFMVNVAHAINETDNTGAAGLTVTDPSHPVTLGLPTSFTWLTPPPYDDGVSPTNGGAEVVQYTETSWTAVTVFEGASGGSVVYNAFPLYCLNQPERDELIINSVNWLLPHAHGDVNGDGSVDASDLSEWAEAYGSDPSKPNWNRNCDFNRDCKVDAFDLFDLGKNYGKTI